MVHTFFRRALTICLAILVYGSAAQQADYTELARYIEKARTDWNVPGVAVAIVSKDKVLFSRGFGVREIGKPEAVTPATVFAIASNSKAFTSTALGMLVDEGKVRWTDKVVDYLPWFQLNDPYVTQQMTLRDLLTHRTGLATFSGDLIWYGTKYNREEVVKRARHLRPVYGFREAYGYSNIMYLAAGLVVEKVTGRSWDEFIAERILKPLQMNRSVTTIRDVGRLGNVSAAHTDFEDRVITVPLWNWDNIAPAGSILSSVDDVAKWLQFQLNSGRVNGEQLVSQSTLWEQRQVVTPLPVTARSRENFPGIQFRGYGLGWSMMDYNGFKVIGHSGGYDGFISYAGFLPEADRGFVILTNKNSSLYAPIMYRILDELTGAGQMKDWSGYYLGMMNQGKREDKQLPVYLQNTTPSLPLESYTGRYRSEVYGDVLVDIRNGGLYVTFGPTPLFHSPLAHKFINTFAIRFPEVPSLPEGTCNFIINSRGGVSEMQVDIPNPDFDFTELKLLKVE